MSVESFGGDGDGDGEGISDEGGEACDKGGEENIGEDGQQWDEE